MKNLFTTKKMMRMAYVASLYAVLTIVFAPTSYGAVQFRFSEVLTILPLFMPESIVGLFIGCVIANVLGLGIYDIIFGSLTTLIAGILTFLIGRMIKNPHIRLLVGAIPPIVLNALVVPIIIILYGESLAYWLCALSVFAGQSAVILGLGIPLNIFLVRTNFKSFLSTPNIETKKEP